MAPYKIIKQGYALKEPPPSKRGLRKKLNRYWFVLVEDKLQVALVYFKNEDSYIARQRNEGFIRIDDSLSIDVIGDYHGKTNAFTVTTPKHKYTLVTESRYDLHEWIYTLHNTLEAFKKRRQRSRERHEQRQRASTMPSGPPTGRPLKTPPLTPTRRAPPPPPAAAAAAAGRSRANSSSDAYSKRKPSRPAPAAPRPKTQRTQSESGSDIAATSPALRMLGTSSPSPLGPEISVIMTSVTPPISDYPASPFDTLTSITSDHHPIMDLNISEHSPETETDTDPSVEVAAGEAHTKVYHKGGSDPGLLSPPLSMQFVSENDSGTLNERTHSMPDLCKHESSASPEAESVNYPHNLETKILPKRISLSQDNASPGRGRHTRHLSLVGVKHSRKKKSTRRQGSIKVRSRSPPNLPPPPPPPEGEEENDMEEKYTSFSNEMEEKYTSSLPTVPTQLSPRQQQGAAQQETLTSQHSSTSLGFTDVMNTISNIDQQLDQLTVTGPTSFATSKPTIPVPRRPPPPPGYKAKRAGARSSASPEAENEELDFSCLDEEGTDSFSSSSIEFQVYAGGGRGEDTISPPANFAEHFAGESEEAGVPPAGSRVTPEGGPLLSQEPVKEAHTTSASSDGAGEELIRKNTSPVEAPSKQVPSRISFPENGVPEKTLPSSGKHSPKEKKHKQVMFREEVEDIPSYEPRVDKEMGASVDTEIPSSIVELKKMLFGKKAAAEQERERSRSPPTQDSHVLSYGQQRDSSLSPTSGSGGNRSYGQQHDSSLSPTSGSGGNRSYGQQRDSSLSPTSGSGGNRSYGQQRDSSLSPVSGSGGNKSPPGAGEPPPESADLADVEGENPYDVPWETKLASKFVQRPGQKSPVSPEMVHFVEVSSHDGPVPGNLELRNVHSLERPRKKVQPPRDQSKQSPLAKGEYSKQSPPAKGAYSKESLLESISSTLQVRSKYGSDSLLSSATATPGNSAAMPPRTSISQDNSPNIRKKMPNEVKRSMRGELAKIRAEHRRDPRYLPHTSPKSHMNGGAMVAGAGRPPARRVAYEFNSQPPRAAVSMDGLERTTDTHVSFDRMTQSHVLRSLV